MKKFLSMLLCVAILSSLTVCELKCSANNTNSANGLQKFADYFEKENSTVIEKTDDGSLIITFNTNTNLAIPATNNISKTKSLEQSIEPLSQDALDWGDINSDGKLNNKDLALLMQYINEWNVVVNLSASDTNNDGIINNKDYARLMQRLNGWDVKDEYHYTTGQKHKKLHYTERYLYSTLNDEQKGWYQAIDKAVNNLDEEVIINSDLSIDRNYYIFYMYLFDNPEHFYLCNTVTVYNYGDGTTALRFYYSVSNQKGEYCGYGYGPLTDELKSKIIAKKAIFEEEVNRIISTIPANAPDVWKERLVYDRILMDGYYNLSARWDGLANDNWTAYGLLVNKYGVCESYSEAFQTLCAYVGVKCTGVVGTAGGGHKWNAVELDGEWYMCDITFDDPIGGEQGAAYHYYFNRTSEWFTENNHDWSDCDFDVPQCNGTKYDFDAYFGTSRWN